MDHLSIALNQTFQREGGFSNNLKDSGGKTNWGITESLARRYGYSGPMEDLTRGQAIRIYQQEFWFPLQGPRLAELSPVICYEIFDTGVNLGTHRAGVFLQRSLNVLNREQVDYADVTVDGVIGPQTLGALREFLQKRRTAGELVLLRMLNALQGSFYVDLAERREKDETFIYGWFFHRIS